MLFSLSKKKRNSMTKGDRGGFEGEDSIEILNPPCPKGAHRGKPLCTLKTPTPFTKWGNYLKLAVGGEMLIQPAKNFPNPDKIKLNSAKT
jgi:hypothetical protein